MPGIAFLSIAPNLQRPRVPADQYENTFVSMTRPLKAIGAGSMLITNGSLDISMNKALAAVAGGSMSITTGDIDLTMSASVGAIAAGSMSVSLPINATMSGAAMGGVEDGEMSIALGDLPPSGYRYIRINVSAGQTSSAGLTWRDVEIRISGVDQVGSGTASASSSQGSFVPANAFDGSFTSVWASDFSNTWPQWLKYDFGAGNELMPTDVRIAPDTGLRAPKDFTIEGSNDNSSWTTLATLTSQTGWTNASYRTFTI